MVIVVALLACLYDAITAAGEGTVIQTRVVIVGVTVVAGFDAGAHHPISTNGNRASVRATVVIVGIAVVTTFARLHEAIATGSR